MRPLDDPELASGYPGSAIARVRHRGSRARAVEKIIQMTRTVAAVVALVFVTESAAV
jgi:hypothetical protein